MTVPSRFSTADLPRRAVMGVVNVTPDSFSDGGRFLDPRAAVSHGIALVEAGASILDVGGESTRPGATPISTTEELDRVLPVVRELVDVLDVPISVDTTKAAVAARALDAGARVVNDVSGGTADPAMRATVAEHGAGFVVMHMRGTPATMQSHAQYDDVVAEVGQELRGRVEAALDAGIPAHAIVADPGIGFAKTPAHNLALLRNLPEVAVAAGVPLLVGASRKTFLGRLVDGPPDSRDVATLATTVWCFVHGAAIVRVHDVGLARRAAELLDVMERATPTGMAA